MSEQELTDFVENIDKKLNKLLNLQTKIAKALHLIPVTSKEEKALQLLQRKNAKLAEQVYDELEKMSDPNLDNTDMNLFKDVDLGSDVYSDVVGSDFLDDFRKK